MRLRMALMLTLTLGTFAAPALAGCGEGTVSDSNTSSVENGKRAADANTVPQGQADGSFILLDMVKESVVEALGENYWPDKQLTKEELETETGISEEMYTGYLAEKQNVETDIDMLVIVRAKQDHLAEIETLLNEYRDSLLIKYKERPQELGKVAASRIETIDGFICFVQLGADTSDAAQEGDEDVIAQCQQENERAVDIIEKTIFEALLLENDG